jgi:hypothetical protein
MASGGGPGSRERAWTGKRDPASQDPAPAGVYGGRFEPPTYVIRQQAFDQPGYAPYPPAENQGGPPPARRSGSTGGCVMGLIAFAVICALTAALAGLAVGKPLLEDAVGEELKRAVSTEVIRELDASVGAAGIAPGTYVLSAEEINAELAANPDRYEPIENPKVTIDEDGLEIEFKVYGLESSYRGMVEAEQGQIVLTNVKANGAAGQILSPSEVREIVEDELNAYFARSGVSVSEVELSDGQMTVITGEAGAPSSGGSARPTRTPAGIRVEGEATRAPTRTPTSRADEDAPPTATRGFFIPFPQRTPTPRADEA